MKVAKLRRICNIHNIPSKGVVKGLLITRLKSFAAGEYVPQPEPVPEPELPMNELIEKMQQEFDTTYEMSISEQEGVYNLSGFLGKKDPNLAKKTSEISNGDDQFVASKWIQLRSKGCCITSYGVSG